MHCHRRKLAGCDFRELPKLSRSMIRALDDLVDKDIRDVIMKNGGVKRIFKVCLLYTYDVAMFLMYQRAAVQLPCC
jgi:hypothetical protein